MWRSWIVPVQYGLSAVLSVCGLPPALLVPYGLFLLIVPGNLDIIDLKFVIWLTLSSRILSGLVPVPALSGKGWTEYRPLAMARKTGCGASNMDRIQ
jgi:hypothetical protein